MIEAIDDRLAVWTNQVDKDAAVSFASPGREEADEAVGIYLIDLLPNPGAKGAMRAPIQIFLRYLVSTRSSDPRQAHDQLGRLVIAALQEEDFEVELAPPERTLWTAFGVEPRPCFFLRLPLRWERPPQPAPLVRQPLLVRQRSLRTLNGLVFGPGDVRLRDAVVEWRGAVSVPTDSSGRFRLTGFWEDGADEPIRVRLRQHEFTFPVPRELEEGQPMTIRLGEMEV